MTNKKSKDPIESKEEYEYEEDCSQEGNGAIMPVQSLPGFPIQNTSRSNFFDGKNMKMPKVKSFWESQEDDEINS